MLKRRGADRVVAVDVVDSAISEARLLTEVYETPVEIVQRDAYEFLVDNRDQFDHVLFLGLFYHLRSPLFVLDRLAAITRERLYFQTWVRNEGAPLRAARRLLFAAYQAGVLRQREGWRRAIGAAWHTLNHRLELGNLPIDDSYLMSHPDFPRMSFIPRGMNGDTTNWWVGDTNTVRAILDSAGFRRVRQLSDDTFLCDNAPEPARDAA
jgi:tRNA (mo5U34)-methyltransferase